MKQLIGLCLILIASFSGTAQSIQYTPYDKFDSKAGDFSVVGRVGDRIYTYRASSDGYFLDAWNDSMTKTATIILDFFPEHIYDTKFITYTDRIIVLFQGNERGHITQYAASLDGMGRLQGKIVTIDDAKTSIWGTSGTYFSNVISEDKHFITVYATSLRGSSLNLRTVQLNDSLRILKRAESEYKGEGTLTLLPALIDNNGRFFLPVTTNSGTKDYVDGAWLLGLQDRRLRAYPLSLGEEYGTGLYFNVDNTTNSIYLGGFYSSKKAGDLDGILFAQFPIDSAHGIQTRRISFDERLQQQVAARNARKAFNDFKTRQLIIRKDGGFVLIAEDYSMNIRSNNVAPYGYYSAYYSPFVGAQNLREFRYGDIVALSYNAEGQREWTSVIRKEQYSQEDAGMFSSYALINSGGSLGFLYNNYDAQRSRILLAVMDETGQLGTHTLDAGSSDDPDWLPRAGKQVSAHELVIPALRRRQICFVKIVF
jgi:hypothetical protein